MAQLNAICYYDYKVQFKKQYNCVNTFDITLLKVKLDSYNVQRENLCSEN